MKNKTVNKFKSDEDAKKLQAQIEENKKKRGEECLSEINAALKKYNCELVGKVMFHQEHGIRYSQEVIAR